jgi:hypothetical protein
MARRDLLIFMDTKVSNFQFPTLTIRLKRPLIPRLHVLATGSTIQRTLDLRRSARFIEKNGRGAFWSRAPELFA